MATRAVSLRHDTDAPPPTFLTQRKNAGKQRVLNAPASQYFLTSAVPIPTGRLDLNNE
jgi:hypothetical protein